MKIIETKIENKRKVKKDHVLTAINFCYIFNEFTALFFYLACILLNTCVLQAPA